MQRAFTLLIILASSTQTEASDKEDFKAMRDFLEAIQHQGKNPKATKEVFQGLAEGFQHLAKLRNWLTQGPQQRLEEKYKEGGDKLPEETAPPSLPKMVNNGGNVYADVDYASSGEGSTGGEDAYGLRRLADLAETAPPSGGYDYADVGFNGADEYEEEHDYDDEYESSGDEDDEDDEDSSTDDAEDPFADEEETGSGTKESEAETETGGSGSGEKDEVLNSRKQNRRQVKSGGASNAATLAPAPGTQNRRRTGGVPNFPTTVAPPPTVFEENGGAHGVERNYGGFSDGPSSRGGEEEGSTGVLTTEKPSEVVHHHHFHHEIGQDHPYFQHIWRKHLE